MKRLIPILLPIAIFIVLGIGGFVAVQAMKPVPEVAEEAPKGLSVFAEPIRRGDLTISVEAQGEVRPLREISLAPQISGRISYVSPAFVDGGFIRRGQVLVRLEAADYELAIVRAKSGIASAEQRLAREDAEAEIARQDIEELGLQNSSALARREPQLAEARASLESARAQLKDAELALARTAIVAPFTGRVREKRVDIGQFASPGQVLGTIFSTDSVEVSLPITDEALGQLGLPIAFNESRANPGPPVTFTGTVAGVQREWTGRIARTSAAINPQTRLITVIAVLDDPYGEGASDGAPMAPGLFVNAKIPGKSQADLLIAPRAALRSGDRVFLGNPKEGTLSIRDVSVVYSDADGAYIESGVEVGELAIVSPIQAGFEGMSITVLERGPDGTIITHTPDGQKTSDPDDEDAAEAALVTAGEGGTE